MLPESRIVARLLVEGVDMDGWKRAIERENALQKRSIAAAGRQANLIRNRLQLMDREHWQLIVNASASVATHALLASAVKHSRLLADFMDIALRDLHRRMELTIPTSCWPQFLEGCAARDRDMPEWSETTQKKLRKTTFQILAQAGYLSDTRKLGLQHVDLAPEVRSYLLSHDEHSVLRCLEVSP